MTVNVAMNDGNAKYISALKPYINQYNYDALYESLSHSGYEFDALKTLALHNQNYAEDIDNTLFWLSCCSYWGLTFNEINQDLYDKFEKHFKIDDDTSIKDCLAIYQSMLFDKDAGCMERIFVLAPHNPVREVFGTENIRQTFAINYLSDDNLIFATDLTINQMIDKLANNQCYLIKTLIQQVQETKINHDTKKEIITQLSQQDKTLTNYPNIIKAINRLKNVGKQLVQLLIKQAMLKPNDNHKMEITGLLTQLNQELAQPVLTINI